MHDTAKRDKLRFEAEGDIATVDHRLPERFEDADQIDEFLATPSQALIDDIDHFLAGQPLDARPDSFAYRTRKFLLRNARAVSAVAVAIVAIGAALQVLGLDLIDYVRTQLGI